MCVVFTNHSTLKDPSQPRLLIGCSRHASDVSVMDARKSLDAAIQTEPRVKQRVALKRDRVEMTVMQKNTSRHYGVSDNHLSAEIHLAEIQNGIKLPSPPYVTHLCY